MIKRIGVGEEDRRRTKRKFDLKKNHESRREIKKGNKKERRK